jgi:hypothetical protein
VIVVMPSPKNSTTLHAKLGSNIREIQARRAITIVIAEEADDMVRPYPTTCLKSRRCQRFPSRCCRRSRCRCSRRRSPRPKPTTSTNPAT